MPRKTKQERQCEACPRFTTELRRGMCTACYRRWHRGSPAVASACVVCGLSDGRLLRAVRLADGEPIVACRNDGWLIERARPKPLSIDDAIEVCRLPQPARLARVDRELPSPTLLAEAH